MWLCFGDFNDVVSAEDKLGDIARIDYKLFWGRQIVEDRELLDVGFVGHPFTRTNGRDDAYNIQCRLDIK